jgi:hypothetical protein
MQKLDLARLRKCETQGTCWDLGNQALYDLCEKYPRHNNLDEILAKIWIIGRSYAAAIERRPRAENIIGEKFYEQDVGPKMLAARIDKWFQPLRALERPSVENAAQIIAVHKKLTDLFYQITGLEKRSLASKYLHFHFPRLFYLYDSRATRELSKMPVRARRMTPIQECDNVYASHFLRSLELVRTIHQEHGIYLGPRRLDDYLLGFGE